jgi:hypothetical protein
MPRGIRRTMCTAMGAGVALVMFATPALAAAPVRGATYKGQVRSGVLMFAVSSDGRSVLNMRVGQFPPDGCGGGGPPPIEAASPAPINNGKFTAHVTYRSSTGKLIATAKVTGEFLTNRKEQGLVASTIPDDPKCGVHLPYTTTAAQAGASVRGAAYRGRVSSSVYSGVVKFAVSGDGRLVLNMRVGQFSPDGCGGGGPPPIEAASPAPIKNGKFTAHVSYRSSTGKLLATVSVTGEFLTNRKEQGVVASTVADDPKCGLNFLPYTTTAQ